MNDILQEILDYYRNEDMESQENLLTMLREIQEAEGYISVEMQTAVTERFSIKPSYLSAVLKRYPSLKEQPSRYDIRVCADSRCRSKAAADVLQEFERQLDIKKGQSTSDGMFSLNTCPCLHLCQKGPNVVINGEIFNHIEKAGIAGLIKRYR